MKFDYIIDKIRNAEFGSEPFRHIEIHNFFTDEDFAEITAAPEIRLEARKSDDALFDELFQIGYKIIEFPGCITDRETYVKWHQDKSQQRDFIYSACEGFGITLRLVEPQSDIVQDLTTFLNSVAFQAVIAEKFGVDPANLTYDAGIQKYLDGYEISPHPDTRKKAMTYMVNINPSPTSEDTIHHTHYLRLRPEYQYVNSFWQGNPAFDRAWLPWDWCETVSIQSKNNSIVIFAPSNDTLHAVKTDYDHLPYQRTQLYGNFWLRDYAGAERLDWEDLVIEKLRTPQPWKQPDTIMASLTRPLRKMFRTVVPRRQGGQNEVEKRFYQN